MKLHEVVNNELTAGQQIVQLNDQDGDDPFFTGEFRTTETSETLSKYSYYDVVGINSGVVLDGEYEHQGTVLISLDLTVDEEECGCTCGGCSCE